MTHCSVSRSLSCPIHPSLLPPHRFIPNICLTPTPADVLARRSAGNVVLFLCHLYTFGVVQVPLIAELAGVLSEGLSGAGMCVCICVCSLNHTKKLI
jgi:hypothetical protein